MSEITRSGENPLDPEFNNLLNFFETGMSLNSKALNSLLGQTLTYSGSLIPVTLNQSDNMIVAEDFPDHLSFGTHSVMAPTPNTVNSSNSLSGYVQPSVKSELYDQSSPYVKTEPFHSEVNELARNVKGMKIGNEMPQEGMFQATKVELSDHIDTPQGFSQPNTPAGPLVFESAYTFVQPIMFQVENVRMSDSQSAELLQQMFVHLMQQRELLNRVNSTQREVVRSGAVEGYHKLAPQHILIRNALQDLSVAVDELFDSVVLKVTELWQLVNMRSEINALTRQLTLLEAELMQMVSPAPQPPCFAELVISKQPFPLILYGKGRQIPEESLEVHVLTGSNTSIVLKGPMVATLVGEGSLQGEMLEPASATASVSLETRSAKFGLKFVNSTRRLPVNVRFSLNVCDQATNSLHTIHSALTRPMVVTTHDTQWDAACGILMKKELFEDPPVVILFFLFFIFFLIFFFIFIFFIFLKKRPLCDGQNL